jgi:hypothetical protein
VPEVIPKQALRCTTRVKMTTSVYPDTPTPRRDNLLPPFYPLLSQPS